MNDLDTRSRHTALRPKPRVARWWVALLCLALVACWLPTTGAVPPAAAAIRTPFESVFRADDNGAIAIVGNSQMTCQTSVPTCAAARAGTGSSALNNNDYDMRLINADSDASTTNATSADLALPANSTVLYARLIWGARLNPAGTPTAGNPSLAALQTPAATAYAPVAATKTIRPLISTDPYQASLDVTALVSAAGNGTYWFANLLAGQGTNTYGGWSLVVAYRNPNLPMRNLTVFEGFADVENSAGNLSVSVPVSGFLTPAVGAVNATAGFLAWEGDLGSTGDSMKLNGTSLTDAERPVNNAFDSKIANLGVLATDRSPNYTNTLGVDMGRMQANGVLANGQTSTTVSVATTSEAIYLGLLTAEIDLYTPAFVGISKSVVNLAGPGAAKAGDTLQYTLSFTNSGQDFADDVVIRDPLPSGITYVPGSLYVVTGANASETVPKTDAVDADVGEYVADARLVRVRLGTGANGTAGGTVPVNANTAVTFLAQVDRAASGTSITNASFLDYRARTLNRAYTFTTNEVTTQVQNLADVAITKTASPSTQTAGSTLTYALGVQNFGPNRATSVVAVDTLPDGVRYVSSAPTSGSCEASGQTVTCSLGSLAASESVAIPIQVQILPGAAIGSLVNQARVTTGTTDDVPGNDTAAASTTVTRAADLRLTKTGPATATAGDEVSYLLTATNDGPSTATAASITDALPNNVSLISATPSVGTCDATNNTVTCLLGDLTVDQSASVTITGRVSAALGGDSIDNFATVSSTTGDPADADNQASVSTTITRNADLVVTKTASSSSVDAGGSVTYKITATNEGLSDAAGVVISDPGTPGLAIDTVTPTQGTCTLDDGAARCAVGLITAGSSASVTLVATVAQSRPPGPLDNTATATTATPESDRADNAATASVSVTASADLALTKVADPDPVVLGDPLVYTLQVANAGPSQAREVVITDTLPAGVTFAGSPDCVLGTGRLVTCAVGTLDDGDSATATITVNTPDTLADGETLDNQAVATATTADPQEENNSAAFTSGTARLADLSLVKSTSPDPVVPGEDVTYTLTAKNAGPSLATGVTITDELPDGVTFSSATPAGICSADGRVVTCNLGALGQSASATVELTAAVAPDLTQPTLVNRATVTAAAPEDPTDSNNSATSEAGVAPDADVSVQLTALTPSVAAGSDAAFSLVVGSNGPSAARGAVVIVEMPEGLLPVLDSADSPCTVTERTVTCVLPEGFGPEDELTVSLTARVLPWVPAGTVTGTASVGTDTPDSGEENNSAQATFDVVTEADLEASKTVSPESLVPGSPASYLLSATNRGPSDAVGVTLSDTLPDGLAITGVSPSTGECTVTGQRVECAVSSLSPDAALTVQVDVEVAPGLTGSIANTLTVGSDTTDPGGEPGTTEITTPIAPRADLRLTKSASPDLVLAGNAVTYQLTAFNAGPSNATDVVLTDDLPAGTSLIEGGITAPEGVECEVDGSAIRCTLGTMAVNEARVVTVEALVDAAAGAGAAPVNTAVLSSPTPGDLDSRTDSVTSTVATEANLQVVKTGRSEAPVAGGEESYVITVISSGPSVARNVVLTDTLLEPLSFVEAVTDHGTCQEQRGVVSCALGDLNPGEIGVVQVTASIDPGAGGATITNSASVDSDTPDPGASDNRASVSGPTSAVADLSVTKSVSPDPATAGDEVTWTLAIANSEGPSTAREVVLTDVLPAGVHDITVTAPSGVACTDEVVCTIDELPPGPGAVTITVRGRIASDYDAGTLANTATVTADTADFNASNNTATSSGTVSVEADLVVEKTGPEGVISAGETLTWQVTLTNQGPSLARDVVITDVLPPGISEIDVTVDDGETDCTTRGQTVACAVGDVPANDPIRVTISGRLAADYVGSSVVNTATARSSVTSDPDPDTNTSEPVLTETDRQADLSISKSVTPNPVEAGAPAVFVLEVANAGPSTAIDTVVTDAVVEGMAIGTVTTSAGSCTVLDQVVTCSLGELAPDQQDPVRIEIPVDVGGDFDPNGFANTAVVAANTPDPNQANNSAAIAGDTTTRADLELTKTGPDTVQPGGAVSWTVTVANRGPATARLVSLTDQVPADVQIARVEWEGNGCTIVDQLVSCGLGSLAADDETVVTIVGTLVANVGSALISNSATVVSATLDPEGTDNLDTATTAVGTAADLSLTKELDTSPVVAGEPVSWTLTVANAGPATAYDVVVTDPLPAGVSWTTGSPGCEASDQTVTCSVSAVPVGESVALTLTGALAAEATGTLRNSATVGYGDDPDAGDNQASVSAPITRVGDLSVAKQGSADRLRVGDEISYTVTAGNAGPSAATGVVVREAWPDGVEFLRSSASQGSYDPVDREWSVGSLGPAGSATLVLVGRMVAAGQLSNSVSIGAVGVGDPDSTNDQAAFGTRVVGANDPLARTGGQALALWVGLVGLLALAGGIGVLRRRRRRA